MRKEDLIITNADNCEDGMGYLFISYSSGDSERVFNDYLIPMQEQYGVRMFFDNDFKNHAEQSWTNQMRINLGDQQCKGMIIFESENYVKSYACLLEVLHAIAFGKKMIRVQLSRPAIAKRETVKTSATTKEVFEQVLKRLEAAKDSDLVNAAELNLGLLLDSALVNGELIFKKNTLSERFIEVLSEISGITLTTLDDVISTLRNTFSPVMSAKETPKPVQPNAAAQSVQPHTASQPANNKCPSCGGEMELSLSNKRMVCPFCDSHIDVDIQGDDSTEMLSETMFDFLWDLDSLKQYENVVTVLDSMRYCLNTLKTAEEVTEFIRTALLSDEDVASEGINQKRIDKIMPKIAELLEPGERIIVYGDDGIFSRGKDFFVITDKRSIFVKGKKSGAILHSEIGAMRLAPNEGYPRWKLNNQDRFTISGIGVKYRLEGAIAALICLFAAEQRDKKTKIKLL